MTSGAISAMVVTRALGMTGVPWEKWSVNKGGD